MDDNETKLIPLMPPSPILSALCKLQNFMEGFPQQELTANHHFGPGVYVRELAIPADTVAIGKTHGKEHLLIIANGDVTIVTEEGRQRVRGPAIMTSPAGVKRAVYTHEDTTFITIHPTDETDVDKIEAEVIIPDRPDALSCELTLEQLLEEIKL